MAQTIDRPTYGSSRLLAAALAGMALIGAGGASAQNEDGASDDTHARSHPIREGGHTVSPNPQSTRAGDPIPGIDITCDPLCGEVTAQGADGDTDGDGLADPSDTARGRFKAGKALAETVKHNEQPAGIAGGPGDADGDGLGDAALDNSAASRSGRNPQTGKEIK